MTTIFIIILGSAFVLLALLLWTEKKNYNFSIILSKTPLSVLFVITATLQSQSIDGYSLYLIIGLVLCLGGDVFLAIPGDKPFMAGLVSFLLGHVLYCVAFFSIGNWTTLCLLATAVAIVVSALVYWWLYPHLGDMKIPVLLYVITITVMVIGAFSVTQNQDLPPTGSLCVLLGALLFYLSDLCVARDRFFKLEYVNRLVGLPLYYASQFMLAFTPGLLFVTSL